MFAEIKLQETMPKRSRSSAGLPPAWPTDPRAARSLAREQHASLARLAAHGSNAQAEAQAEPQALIDEKKAHEAEKKAHKAEKKAHKATQRQMTAFDTYSSNKIARLRDTIGELKLAMPSICARSSAGGGGGGGGACA